MNCSIQVTKTNPLTIVLIVVVFFVILAVLDYFAINLVSFIMTLILGSSNSPRYLYTGILTRLTDPVGLSVTILVIVGAAIITLAIFSEMIKKKTENKEA